MTDFSGCKRLTIPEGAVKAITQKSNGQLLWKSGYTNQVPLSTNADGSIYNGGLGYKNGYRIRSGGAELAYDGACCTGFIPVNGASVLRVSGYSSDFKAGGVRSSVNAFDAGFTNLGQIVGNYSGYGIFADPWTAYNSNSVAQEDNCWSWTLPPEESGIAYVRVTAAAADGSKLIVTVDEPME